MHYAHSRTTKERFIFVSNRHNDATQFINTHRKHNRFAAYLAILDVLLINVLMVDEYLQHFTAVGAAYALFL